MHHRVAPGIKFWWHLFTHLAGEGHCDSKVSCPEEQNGMTSARA